MPKGDTLDLLGLSPAAARVVRYFLVRPEARPHAREVQRTLELGGASTQRELGRLVGLGALRKEQEGNRTHYVVVQDAPLWKAVRILEATTPDPAPLLRDALADVSGLHAVFIFGSMAIGEEREDSDIDVMVVEEPGVDHKELVRQLAEVGLVLGREVNAVRYTPRTLAERLGNPGHPAWGFVRGVLTGPKNWVAGAASALEPIAFAAGIRPEELGGATA